jgi:hypothetical protein
MPKVLVNAYGVTCEKCDKKVPAKYYYGLADDESWIECIHNGWYCPDHSPTSNCDDMDCECCNPNYEDEEEAKTVDFDKYPKRTHQLICRSCGMPDYYENIADDPTDDEYGMCGDCE